jgi:hypothetical protein
MNFRVGQKVVCVNASASAGKLQVDNIYEITGKEWLLGKWAIHLRNVDHPPYGFPWYAYRFRPLVKRKTDAGMAILNKILIDAENFKVVEDA